MNRIDAHLHVWDLTTSAYSWLGPQHGPLFASFSAEQAHTELQAAGFDAAVLVQAEDSLRDTEFLLDIAAANSWVAGVVGWVPLEHPVAAERSLERWQQHSAFRGVRHLVHNDPRDDFLSLPSVRQSLATVARHGLTFDVPDAWPRHLAAAGELAGGIPELVVVIDHLGKPPIGRGDFSLWRDGLACVARRENTVAKVSGLRAPGAPYSVAALRPAWESALELFGPRRLMFGGDWPMSVPYGGYPPTWEVLAQLISELSSNEQIAITSGTAERVYRLDRWPNPDEG